MTMVACHLRHTNREERSSKGDSFKTCESIFPRSSGGRGKVRLSTCHKRCQSHRPCGRILIAYPSHLPLRSWSVEFGSRNGGGVSRAPMVLGLAEGALVLPLICDFNLDLYPVEAFFDLNGCGWGQIVNRIRVTYGVNLGSAKPGHAECRAKGSGKTGGFSRRGTKIGWGLA